MPNIPLEKAQIIWSPIDGSLPPIKVVGGTVPDDNRYNASWGACNGDFSEANLDQKKKMILTEFVRLVTKDNIPAQDVMTAFSDIPEWQDMMIEGAVIPDPEDY